MLLVDLTARLPHLATERNAPKRGAKGVILGVQIGTGHLLVKWRGRAWPISVSADEVAWLAADAK